MEKYSFQLKALRDQEYNRGLSYTLTWSDKNILSENIESSAGLALSRFQEMRRSEYRQLNMSLPNREDVIIFPIIQGGQFNVREEEHCLKLLFKHLSNSPQAADWRPLLDLTSGYFSLYSPYQQLVQRSTVGCRIVVASPVVNIITSFS